jgi:hypothetical protein
MLCENEKILNGNRKIKSLKPKVKGVKKKWR